MIIEIFKTGKQTDSKGRENEWKESDLDEIIKNFESDKDGTPLVLGHPKDNDPAVGWVKKVFRKGQSLWMETRDIIPQFADALKEKMFTRVSVSIAQSEKGKFLNHVGFLGAVRPAVEGLAPFAFRLNDEDQVFEFSAEIEEEKNFMGKLRDLVLDIMKNEKPVLEIETDEEFAQQTEGEPAMEEENKALKEEIAALKSEIAELKKAAGDFEKAKKEEEFKTFVDGLVTQGKLLKDNAEYQVNLLKTLDQTSEFSKDVDLVEQHKKFLSSAQPLIELGEFSQQSPGKNLSTVKMIEERMKTSNLDYSSAMRQLSIENPELDFEEE